MTKKIDRVFRDRLLSATEVARDAEVRRQVQTEYPPAPPSGGTSGVLSQILRDALLASDRSMVQVAQDAGVSQIVVANFLSGERDIRMATADKLAGALGLKLARAS